MKTQQYYVFTRKRDERVGFENKCVLWWRPNGAGYTTNLDDAGLFTDVDMKAGYPSPKTCMYVPKEVVDTCARKLRLAWWDRITDELAKPQPQPEARGECSGPLPGRDVTVVQTPEKTVFVQVMDGQSFLNHAADIAKALDCQGPALSDGKGKTAA